ncbi:heme lyase CcmF/NrfE family subunit [Gallaecimonas kandeliae]|uniref:heme lyase CcmF/NrfE family subunit n=1 Tax=Gallaecimonas kandeliae TaxID=3029055 RepID=UPI002648579F|nr:heme lyase CcmF/NrfE family subunit [Gallaecimonas kandeliae]WKE67447.1 heme lyase CcmF/NrfE family subunit [Gallaecimonas kandeliae]
MVPELGHFALIVAFFLALQASFYPLWGAHRGDERLMALARPLAFGQLLFVALSFGALVHAFVVNDFSLVYVAAHSNSKLPLPYRISATWGAHEGSLLLWVLILTGWGAAVALFSRALPQPAVARVLAVMGMIGAGFLAFILFTSNPFELGLPYYPVDGADLNPLLQDPGLVVHPPMLYMGYVGFSVAFAFAIAALLSGKLDTAWARWSRPWTAAAWLFLTIGITLGSWWAYYELGWGGWWFWDPVENASFMPWLAGTALMHSLAVSEKRGVFKAWTVLLAIAAFSLSLLGTFLVRSGVLVSVHAFASDPARGLFILAFLVLVIGGSLGLYALRAGRVKSQGSFELLSRETLLLGNNVFLTTACLVVVLGTLMPLVHRELGLGAISVGAPFFNSLFTWLFVPFAFAMGAGPLARWKREPAAALLKRLSLAFALSLVLGVSLPLLLADKAQGYAMLGLALAAFILITSVLEVQLRVGNRHGFFQGLLLLSRSHWAMILGHLGLAVTVIGIALTTSYSVEKDVRLKPGETYELAGYGFHFDNIGPVTGPNYQGYGAHFSVSHNGKVEAQLDAQKRFYSVAGSVMTEAGIDPGLGRDLYVALGEQLKDGSWAVRLHVKPFVRWIWGGGIIMAFAGLLVVTDRRYRFKKLREAVA